jgi:NADH-quinone oxidoreductase subunit M
MKKMIAYSSIAHMGIVTIGIFAMNTEGLSGSIIQMIGHGLVSAALFLCIGVLYDRLHTKEIAKYGGVTTKMPGFSLVFMLFTMASVGLPGTISFIGEITVLLSIFKVSKIYALGAVLSLVLGAMYMLSLYKRVMFGEVKNQDVEQLNDLTIREYLFFVPLAVFTLLLGIYPSLLIDILDVPVADIVAKIVK